MSSRRASRHALALGSLLPLLAGCASSRAKPAPAAPVVVEAASPAAFFGVSVADLDRMLPWYRDVLGFRVHSTGTGPDGKFRFALLLQGRAMVELIQLPDAKPLAEVAPGVAGKHLVHGVFKGGFVVDGIDREYARLRALGVSFAYELVRPPNDPYRSFGVEDPEGNLLQFFGP